MRRCEGYFGQPHHLADYAETQLPFKLLWECRSPIGKRKFSLDWTPGARAYLRGHHGGRPYFESLETNNRKVALSSFTIRAAKIFQEHDERNRSSGRCNFAYAIMLYFGTSKPEERDPTGRVAKLFDTWAKKYLDEISQVDLDKLALELYPKAGPKTLNREVYTPFVSVYNAAVADKKAPERKWKRPFGCHKKAKNNAPTDTDINKLMAVASNLEGRNKQTACRNRAAILTMTLTGERTTAATVKMLWKHINFEQGTIYFPATKNGEERIVMMAPILARALKELSGYGCEPEETVFRWKTRTGMAQMVQKARKKAAIGNFRPHDIGRHGFSKRMIQKAGLSRPELKKAGNWKSDAAVAVYEHFELNEIDMAVRDVDTSELELPKPSDKTSDKEPPEK